jgi:glycine/D-amino acid oxidase-like deaminating enzyme/nitrite reductase/ring-hydroxylating ferredoxin subunit
MEKTTTPLWVGTAPAPRFDRLRTGVHVDVAIIGAGITGLTAAVLLKERGRTVAVIEKGSVAGGESGHTTAHLTEAVDARYHSIARTMSKEAARLVAEASRASIEQIAALIERYSIRCGFRRLPGYLYSETRDKVSELKKEAAAAREAGLATTFIDDVPLPFDTRGAVRWENQAQFHPREYLIALAARVPGDGSYLFDETYVEKIEDGEPCVVETAGGRLTAGAVFQATNVPVSGFNSVFVRAFPYRTYALAYRVDGNHPDGLFWDTFDPYHYTRWQETSEGVFMIVGGADHKVGDESDTEKPFAEVHQYVVERFGERSPAYRWSGQVLEPADGLPFIGGSGNIYISTGYAGQGMTFGTVGGMIVSDLITGRPNAWAELFDVKRLQLRGAMKDLVVENLDYPRHMIEDRVARLNVEGKHLLDVERGEGKIISLEGKKVALHRDAAGALHAVSPVCTHMGCDVAWNAAEKSWDCPCHGSRFGVDGGVIHGPAQKALTRYEIEERKAPAAADRPESRR